MFEQAETVQYLNNQLTSLNSSGSETSGSKMTPLFQDGVRGQVIIDLMQTGFPTVEMGFGECGVSVACL